VALAASGGKDSTLLAVALRELGYRVSPIAIDMNYSASWAGNLHKIYSSLGFSLRLVKARESLNHAVSAPPALKEAIRFNIQILDAPDRSAGFTPCTHCYNVKAASLTHAVQEIEADVLAFGHHRTDALSSLLKSAFMYMDRWDGDNPAFNRQRFEHLIDKSVDELSTAITSRKALLVERISELVQSKVAGTDEPPQQLLRIGSTTPVRLVRPLFFLWEREIAKSVRSLSVSVEGSGCGHGATKETQTPREMIQWRILNREDFFDCWFMNDLGKVLDDSVLEDGGLAVNVRNLRPALLGDRYKGPLATSAKL
jgi:hypothetical protein